MNLPLWAHQNATVERALVSPALFDCSDPGTGKTRAHLEAFALHKAQGLTSKCLILCPKSLIGPAWAQDLFRFFPTISHVSAYAENREEAFSKDRDVYITNYEGVKYLALLSENQMRKLFGENPTLIIDEITAFKNHAAKRSKYLIKILKYFKWRRGLTGTPTPNSVTELWHPVFILDQGERLGDKFYRFRAQVQEPVHVNGFPKWEDKPNAMEAVSLLIRDITIRHSFDSVMDVPEIFHRTVEFDLSPKMQKIYDESLKQNRVFLDEFLQNEVLSVNAAVFLNKLLQLLSGAVYQSDGSYELIDTGRYELIADLAAERQHSIIFISWKHQAKQLGELLHSRGISHELFASSLSPAVRDKIVEDYQAGKLQSLIMHPKTGAHGLTLTRGRSIIWASPRYEADFLKQGIARIRRGVQQHKTENLMLTANSTIEQEVYHKLFNKLKRMDSLLTQLE